MEIDALQKMCSVEREDVCVYLCRFDAPVTEQLADKLQRSTVQQQMHRETVSEGMAADLERWLSPHLLSQPINVGTDRLACDGKYALVFSELTHPQVTLDPSLEGPVQNWDKPFRRTLEAALARPPCPLLKRL